jgi:phosphoribosylformylglycinamidine synthase
LEEFELHNALRALADAKVLHSASDVSDGGLAVSLAKACMPNNIGVWIHNLHVGADGMRARELFGEDSSLALISCAQDDISKVKKIVAEFGFVFPIELGLTIQAENVDCDPDFTVFFADEPAVIETTLAELRAAYCTALERQLAKEVYA